jgi:hypothetical protein
MSLSKEDLHSIRDLFLEAFEAVAAPRFDEIDKHLAEHDKHFERIDKHLTEHDRRFDEIDRRLGNIETRLTSLEGCVEALENDVKDIYGMVPNRLQLQDGKLSPEQRLRQLYTGMQVLARELKVEL